MFAQKMRQTEIVREQGKREIETEAGRKRGELNVFSDLIGNSYTDSICSYFLT